MTLLTSVPAAGPEPVVTASVADLYRAMWRHGRAKRGLLIAAGVAFLVSELLKLMIPWLAARGIDALQAQGIQGAADAGLWLLAMFSALLVAWAFYGPARVMERNFALEVRTCHTDVLLDRLLHAPLGWHESRHTGELANRLSKSTYALFCFAQEQYIYLKCLVMLIGPLIALWLISPWVGALALLGHAAIVLASMRMDGRLIRLAHEENEAESELTALLYDMLSNVFTIFSLRRRQGLHNMVLKRLLRVFEPLREAIVWGELKWALVDISANLLWCGLVAVYVWDVARATTGPTVSVVLHANVAIGGLFMVYQYAKLMDGIIGEIASQFSSVARYRADFASQQPILEAARQETEARRKVSWDALQLDQLVFSYPQTKEVQAALRGVNLNLRRGRRYGLVGPSGGGKSSLLRVLAGLDSPQAGTIRSDGIAWDAQALRESVTLIPQRAEMICASVRDNLALGDDYLDEQLWQVLQTTAAYEFVAPLATGLATVVSEAGGNWSGGQMQRLALARGLLAARGSSLVLLDEPSNSLDAETERRVLAALLRHFGDACVVASIHQLQLLDLVDEVIVMDQGRVVDVGLPAALLGRCPLFKALFDAQIGSEANA